MSIAATELTSWIIFRRRSSVARSTICCKIIIKLLAVSCLLCFKSCILSRLLSSTISLILIPLSIPCSRVSLRFYFCITWCTWRWLCSSARQTIPQPFTNPEHFCQSWCLCHFIILLHTGVWLIVGLTSVVVISKGSTICIIIPATRTLSSSLKSIQQCFFCCLDCHDAFFTRMLLCNAWSLTWI